MKKIIIFILFLCSSLAYSQDSKENTDLSLAQKLYEDKLYDLSLEQFKRVSDLYPGSQQGIQAKYYIGLCQFQLKKYDECRATLTNFAVNYPHFPNTPNAWWKIAESYEMQGRNTEAAAYYEKLKLFHPTSELAPQALLRAGELMTALNDFENAQRVLKILIQEYGFNDISYMAKFKLAEIYAKLELNEKAIGEFNKLLEINISDELKYKSCISIGKIYAKTGNIENSEKYFNKIFDEKFDNNIKDSAKCELARIYSDLGESEKAIDLYLTIIDVPVQDSIKRTFSKIKSEAGYNLIELLINLSDTLRALKYLDVFENSEKDTRTEQKFWFLKAEALRKSGDYKNSNIYYEKYIKDSLVSTDKRRMAILNSAENSENLKIFREAVDKYTYYLSLYPNDPIGDEILFKQGLLYYSEVKFLRRSLTCFSDLLQKYPNSNKADDALFYLGLSHEQNKDNEKALETYKMLEEKYPSSDYIDRAEERMNSIKVTTFTNSEQGFQKLGNLMQDVMSDKPKSEIAFKLGEVYFNDLKNYKAALSQFDIAISSGVKDSLKTESMIYQAFCHYYLAQEDSTERNKAISLLDDLIKLYPNTPKRDEILEYSYKLRIYGRTNKDINNLSLEFLKNNPGFNNKNYVILNILKSYFWEGKYKELIEFSNENNSISTDEKYNNDYYFYLGFANHETGTDSLCEKYFNLYLNKNQKGKYQAQILNALSGIRRERKDYQNSLILSNKIISDFYYISDIDKIKIDNAKTYYISGDYNTSYKLFLGMLNSDIDNPFIESSIIEDLYYWVGLTFDRLGKNFDAKRYYLGYISRYKKGKYSDEIYFNLGRIYQNEERNELALNSFRKIDPEKADPELSLKVADYLYENGSYKDAASKYQNISKISKDEKIKKFAEFKTLILYYKMDNIEEAQKLQKSFIDRYERIDDLISELDYERGYYYYRQKNYELANKIFNDIIDDYENTEFAAWSSYWIGKYEESNSQNEKAQKRFEQIIEKFPDSKVATRASLALGNLYFRGEKYETAIKYYRNIVDHKMDDKKIFSNALDNIIISYGEVGLYDAGIEYCRKFIELFPQDKTIIEKKIRIGIYYQNLKYYDQAIVHYESLLDMVDKKTECEIRYYMGECYYAKVDYQRALVEFLKVPYIFPKNVKNDWTAVSFYLAGSSYEKMAKYEQAITMYQQIIDWPNIDEIFKAKAVKEIERVKALLLPKN
jgi:tetratricopeptide (TPR) repeat protein